MNLEVLQSSKASSTTFLITLEWSLPGVNSDVGHQLVLSIEWFTLSWTVLQNIVLRSRRLSKISLPSRSRDIPQYLGAPEYEHC